MLLDAGSIAFGRWKHCFWVLEALLLGAGSIAFGSGSIAFVSFVPFCSFCLFCSRRIFSLFVKIN